MTDVFISYTRSDRSRYVQPLVTTLQERHNVWYDKSSIELSDSIPLKISEGLGRSKHAIAVISPAYRDSGWCMRELAVLIDAYVTGEKSLVVVRLDEAEIPEIITDLLRIEVGNTSDEAVRSSIAQIVEHLDGRGSRESRPTVETIQPTDVLEAILEADRADRFGSDLLPRHRVRPENEGLILVKPGGTFYEPCLRDILSRITSHCRICQVRLFNGPLIERRKLFDEQYATPSRLASGELPLAEEDFRTIRAIYDTPAFEAMHGVEYSDDLVAPALALTEEHGIPPLELAGLWEHGRRDALFHNERPDGLNKIGYQKSVFPIDLPGIGLRLVLNGFIPGYRHLFVAPEARVVAIHASTTKPWQTIRDKVVGGVSDPHACERGSIRKDAKEGLLPLDPRDSLVNGQRNVCHSSATLFDGMHELCLWFEYGHSETVIGQLCALRGVDPGRLVQLTVRDLPDFSWNTRDEGMTSLLFDLQLRVAREKLRNDVELRQRIAEYESGVDPTQRARVRQNNALRSFVADGLRLSAGGDRLYQHAAATHLPEDRKPVFHEVARRIQMLAKDAAEYARPAVLATAYRIAAGDLMLLDCPAYERVSNPQLFQASISATLAEESLACAARTHDNFLHDLQGLYSTPQPRETATTIHEHPAWAAACAESGSATVETPVVAIVLAGGRSTRMASTIPKPVLPFRDSLLMTKIEETIRSAIPNLEVFAATGFRADLIEKTLGNRVRYLTSAPTLGLAFRTAVALEALAEHGGPTLVVYADMPEVSPTTLAALVERVGGGNTLALAESASDVSGHIVREDGRVVRVVQSRFERPPAMDDMRDVGAYAFRNTSEFRRLLGRVTNDNVRCEFMFADVVEQLAQEGWDIETIEEDPELARGINTPADLLAVASGVLRIGLGAGRAELGAVSASLCDYYGLPAEGFDSFEALRAAVATHQGHLSFFHWWNELWS